MDTFTPDQRSECMRRIRSTDTKPEITVRRLLHRAGFRFRLHRSDLPGKPDIVLPRHKTVVLVHGCLWHGHEGCRRGRRPKSNTEYWDRKIDRNIQRDRDNAELLTALGWKRIVVWECDVKDIQALSERLLNDLRNE